MMLIVTHDNDVCPIRCPESFSLAGAASALGAMSDDEEEDNQLYDTPGFIEEDDIGNTK